MVSGKKQPMERDTFIKMCEEQGLAKYLAIGLWRLAKKKNKRLLADREGTIRWVNSLVKRLEQNLKKDQ